MDKTEPEQIPLRFFPAAPFSGKAQNVLVFPWSSQASSWRLSRPSLPTPLTPLVDREQAVAAVCSRITHPEVRLLTLTGTGGVGKTRLALAAARAVQASFADGVYFVNLSAVQDPDQVLPALAQTLGLQTGTRPPFKVLQAALRHRQLLLLLDSVEQVVQSASLLADLLVSCTGVRLLVTSREPLHVEGEHQFPVPPLPVPIDHRTPVPEELEANPAVRLFLQRAQAIQPAFQLTRANAQTIAAICVQLEGIPLALELAAARIRLFSPKAVLARLDHPLQFLTMGSRSAPPRQQTLRHTIAWSYALLSQEEQTLFRRLCVFVGGWTLPAVQAIVTALSGELTDVETGLAALLDKNLILLDGEVDEVDEQRRFRMLETIRAFGLECLEESGEEVQVRLARAELAQRHLEEASRPLSTGLAHAIQAQSRLSTAMGLEELGKVAAEQGELPWAARLFGAAQALREAMEAPLPPCQQPAYEQVLSSVRVRMGAAHFDAAWAQGHGMTPQQVLQSRHEAMQVPALPSASGSASTAPSGLAGEKKPISLTSRERDVLQLLAQGRTNAQIAEQLVISPFTVKAYVRTIYKKLGVASRAAATRFALDHHLL